MLKKAGIVVTAVTAGLLALSPLAFAGDSEDGDKDWDGGGGDHESSESINVEGNDVRRDTTTFRDNEFCNNNTEISGGLLPPLVPSILPTNIQCSQVEIDVLSTDGAAPVIPPVVPPVAP